MNTRVPRRGEPAARIAAPSPPYQPVSGLKPLTRTTCGAFAALPACLGAKAAHENNCYLPRPHSHHIERGGGTGPMKPRQPPRGLAVAGRCQFQQVESLGDVSWSPSGPLLADQAEVFLRSNVESEGSRLMALEGLRC